MHTPEDEKYMRMAIAQAAHARDIGEIPVGAVVVCDGDVVAEGCNTRESDNDPCGHAELVAMRRAAKRLGRWRLDGCTVYVTLEPCIMCAGAMVQARVSRCVVGALDPKAGALDSVYAIGDDPRLNHSFPTTFGVLESECKEMLNQFFADKRESVR